MKVGELAKRSGISVRTLHHYDQIGLLKPAIGGAGGHRHYGKLELQRLQHILALRQIEFSLSEIGELLDDPQVPLERVIAAQLERMERELQLRQTLRERLKTIHDRLLKREDPSLDDVLHTLEAMNQMNDFAKHYSPEQMEYLERRKALEGEDRMREVQGEWATLFDDFRAAQADGVDPGSERAGELAARFQALIDEFTGGDRGIEMALGKMNVQDSTMSDRMGVEPDLGGYISAVRAAKRPGE